MRINKIVIKMGDTVINAAGLFAVVFFCIVYTVAVNKILSKDYLVAYTAAASYNKRFNLLYLIICILVCLCLYIYTEWATNSDNIQSYTVKFMFWLYCMPISMFPALFGYGKGWLFWIIAISYWIILCTYIKRIHIDVKLKKSVHMPIVFKRWLYIISIIAIVAIIARNLPNFKLSISFRDVYDVRADYKSNANDLMTFVKTAFGAYICPGMLALSISKRNKVSTVVFVLLQIAVFSFARDKTYIIDLILALIFGFLGKKIITNVSSYILKGIICFGCLNIVAIIGEFTNFIFNIVTRRVMVVPAWLNYFYFDYFLGHEKLWWRQDVFLIDKLFIAPYSDTVSHIISKNYLKGLVTNPNAGGLAEAFSQFGFLGLILYPFLIVVLLTIIDFFFKNAVPEAKLMISFSLAFSLANDTIMSTSFVMTMFIICLYANIFDSGNLVETFDKQLNTQTI